MSERKLGVARQQVRKDVMNVSASARRCEGIVCPRCLHESAVSYRSILTEARGRSAALCRACGYGWTEEYFGGLRTAVTEMGDRCATARTS